VKKEVSKKPRGKRQKIIIASVAAIVIAAIVAGLVLYDFEAFSLFYRLENAREFIRSAGIWGPVVFVVLQVLQVIFAPIPGQAVALAGGYIFGWWGLLLSMLGASIGYYLVLIFSKRYGRPLAEKLFKKATIKKFDYMTESNGALVLFVAFLLPFLPDDLICYLAGLTKVRVRYLMLAAVSGRLPSFLIATLIGQGLDSYSIQTIVSLTAAVLLFSAVCYWKRDWIHGFAESKDKRAYIKRHLKLTARQTVVTALVSLAIFTAISAFVVLDF
jgi:uncharacterized membrane protein YdjX (TVP38/TMEM64 family)